MDSVTTSTPNQAPAWAIRLQASAGAHPLTYEDMRDAYTYLRSTKKLLIKVINRDNMQKYADILNEIDYLFSEHGFGDTEQIQQTIHTLTDQKLGPEKSYIDKKIELNMIKKKIMNVVQS